jgi:hypothetical protein
MACRQQHDTTTRPPDLSLFEPQLVDSGWQNQPMPNLLRRTTIAILAATPITALSLFSAGIGSAEPLNCASGQFWDPITNTCQTPQPAQDCASGEYWNALSNVCRPLGQL